MTRIARRSVLTGLSAGLGAGFGALAFAHPALAETRSLPPLPASNVATDGAYWNAVRALYRTSPALSNWENGYWGMMAEPVKEEFKRFNDFINFENTIYARTKWGADFENARGAVAAALGCERDEIALTRGATEALQMLIGGYNKLSASDAVLYADLDYDSMQYTMNWLKDRRGVEVVKFRIPEPATRANVLAAYDGALRANPKIKLVLLTHISHRTGLMMPVREIAAMGKAQGADTIVDAAHSWGQVDIKIADLGTDFAGFNLHKWIGAPLGCGALYIKKDRIADIDRAFADEDNPATDIRSRVHTGTFNFAAMLTIPAALQLHAAIGPAAKEARFRHLRNLWVAKAREIKGIEILTPDDPAMVAGITSFRIAGKVSPADNNAIVATLRDRHQVMTVRRGGITKGNAIRVTPAPYTTEEDVERLVAGLRGVTA